ncbi:hypothetical protein BRADI_4g13710v3 [Brachypodium distachyon]|uniref:phosphatidate phosphatase n=1 Tax=Brachypodium distachyon TaxID=15368 RepID=A0A0Q3L590_BRADI|nr:hypothetical protein BRADI_4g13710v3 [Brachypodium distachyon]
MYAVGKVLYTVAGPFHPFGGAVDIVVVQQQDGSFKSSPWYVRFGKFQGVLKTREKVVNIAVNGVEAGFHMFLDSNGEAHFLRDADSNVEQGDFVVSPLSSGDEREVQPMQDAQFRKSKSTCDVSTMEANAGDGKVPEKTISRRGTILERMFGRKSITDNDHAVDRVGSLERAEIAAELLDTKWSTNLPRGSEAHKSAHQPSSSHLMNAGNGNPVETSKTSLPDCSFDKGKVNCDNVDSTAGSPHGGRSSGEESKHCVQTTSVKVEEVAIYAQKTGDLTDGIISTIDCPTSESMSKDLETDKSISESFSTQGELQGNFEHVSVREIHTKETLSHGIFEIHAIEMDVTDGKSEVVSQFVTVDSYGVDQNFAQTKSPTYNTKYLSSERHDGPLIASGQDACQEKAVIINSTETVESSYDVSNILVDRDCDAEGISLADGLQVEEPSRVSSENIDQVDAEERPQLYLGGSNKGIHNLDVREVSVVEVEDSSSRISQGNLPDKDISVNTLVDDHVMCSAHGPDIDISVDTVANDHSINSDHGFPGASSSENDVDDVAKNSTVETKTCNGEYHVSFIQTSRMENVSSICFAQTASFPNKVEGSVSSLCEAETENTKLEYDENISSSATEVEIGFVPEEPRDEAEAGMSLSEFVEETTDCPNKLEDEVSPIISDFSTLSEAEAKNTKLVYYENMSSSAGEVEIGLLPEEPKEEAEVVMLFSEYVEETTDCPNRLEDEVSPIISDLSRSSKVEAKNTKLEYDENISSSATEVEIGLVTEEPREEAEAVMSLSEYVEETTDFPNRLKDEVSPIISDFSKLSKVEAENTKLEYDENISSSATEVEIGLVPEEPRDKAEAGMPLSEFVEETAGCPYILEDEVSPIISDFFGLSKVEAENTKLEYDENLSSSATEVEIGLVTEEPMDKAEAGMSLPEFVEETAGCPNILEDEVSPIISDFSSLSKHEAENTKLEAENTKLEYDENISSSAGEVEVGLVPEEPRDEAEAVMSLSKLSKLEAEDTKLEFDVTEVETGLVSEETRDEAEAVMSSCEFVEKTADCPNRLEDEVSLIISDISSLSKVEVENTKLEFANISSSASEVEIGLLPEEPRDGAEAVMSLSEFVEKTTDCPNRLEYEVSPIISDFSSLSKVETKNTTMENGENRPVTEEIRDEAEAVVSSSEFIDEIQFQFSDTLSFADKKTLDDLIGNKAAGAGVHDESASDADEQGGDEIDPQNKPEDLSDLSRPETTLISIPGSELHLADNNIEAKSLPNLCSHLHDLERSDSFQVSRSLSNSENNGVDPVKSNNSGLTEQESEGTGDSKENSAPPGLINNPVCDDKHSDDLKVDTFNPFVELSLCRHLLSEGMGADAACKAFDAGKITLEKFRAMKQSLIRNDKLVVRIAGRYFPWDVAAPVVLGMVSFSQEQVFEHQGMIKVERVEPSTTQSGWKIWPFSFRRTRTMNTIQPVSESTVQSSVSVAVKESDGERNEPITKMMERKVRSLTPTSQELASLNLREGRNVVTFTFSTSMLGVQQVDALIYLWKWNTHIVISDVDGTITKSDVLGQFMPMVGVDWSQNGVAHLFSAIKENGYQLLFLSARSISQAHLTRQFLFNLKQDGKALPDGPVVISPDGLFPSLYREVIRRAPHEFKISCLGAIKALFPPDSHPFYAGFGNRDTDELSYLKVGIPIGKIFIINPKGEVAVNRRVDTKSYTSLHALVNRMFPPISSTSEQEDYNTWNFWKMPVPDI